MKIHKELFIHCIIDFDENIDQNLILFVQYMEYKKSLLCYLNNKFLF